MGVFPRMMMFLSIHPMYLYLLAKLILGIIARIEMTMLEGKVIGLAHMIIILYMIMAGYGVVHIATG